MNLISLFSSNKDTKMKLTLCYFIEISCEYSFDDELLNKYAAPLSQIFSSFIKDENL